MEVREDLKYTKEHEWIHFEDDQAVLGITDYAQHSLGDIVYIELPEPGATIDQGESLGTIESVKAVSELFSPVAGEVLDVNGALEDQPELVNSSPYKEGWIVKMKIDSAVLKDSDLLTADEYTKLIGDGE